MLDIHIQRVLSGAGRLTRVRPPSFDAEDSAAFFKGPRSAFVKSRAHLAGDQEIA